MANVSLSSEELAEVNYAFGHPRGRYNAERAAQLSGLPRSTIYEWARERVLVPDYPLPRSKYWSYRDLVFLRMLGWLRSKGVARADAAAHVAQIRAELARPAPAALPGQLALARHLVIVRNEMTDVVRSSQRNIVDKVRTDGNVVLHGSELFDRLTGQGVLPTMDTLFSVFRILEPIDEPGIGNRRLWGPDLVHPSEHTYISPWVMGGEPCVEASRVPTSSLLALAENRGLDVADLVELYPRLSAAAIADGLDLERRLRGQVAA